MSGRGWPGWVWSVPDPIRPFLSWLSNLTFPPQVRPPADPSDPILDALYREFLESYAVPAQARTILNAVPARWEEGVGWARFHPQNSLFRPYVGVSPMGTVPPDLLPHEYAHAYDYGGGYRAGLSSNDIWQRFPRTLPERPSTIPEAILYGRRSAEGRSASGENISFPVEAFAHAYEGSKGQMPDPWNKLFGGLIDPEKTAVDWSSRSLTPFLDRSLSFNEYADEMIGGYREILREVLTTGYENPAAVALGDPSGDLSPGFVLYADSLIPAFDREELAKHTPKDWNDYEDDLQRLRDMGYSSIGLEGLHDLYARDTEYPPRPGRGLAFSQAIADPEWREWLSVNNPPQYITTWEPGREPK